MQVCFGPEAFSQVEILLDTMPFVLVQRTAAEEVEGRACRDSKICHNETGMMCWKVLVDSSGKNFEAVVQEEKKEQSHEQ